MSYRVATYVALARAAAQASPLLANVTAKEGKDHPEWGSPEFYVQLSISIARKLGATIWLVPEDICQVRSRLVTTFIG